VGGGLSRYERLRTAKGKSPKKFYSDSISSEELGLYKKRDRMAISKEEFKSRLGALYGKKTEIGLSSTETFLRILLQQRLNKSSGAYC